VTPNDLGRLPCTNCNGVGSVPVADRNLHVLEALEGAPRWEATTLEIHARLWARGYKRASYSPTATVNALTAMKRAGFVQKLGREGRAYRWRLTPAGASAAHVGGLAVSRRSW